MPSFGETPFAWLDAARAIAIKRRVDVLLPTQEQVAILAAANSALSVATVVPRFNSLRRVQDKISAYTTLAECGVPQPPSLVVRGADDLDKVENFPIFLKRPISTASIGVRRVTSRSQLEAAAASLDIRVSPLLAQMAVSGPLAMVQAIADEGRLLGHHACIRVREGVGGGAAVKESTSIPGVKEHLKKLVSALDWHGPLSMDVILTVDGPVVIDVNPRLVEPMNAFLAGVDLVGAMLELASRRHPPLMPDSNLGVRSFQLLLAILGAAANEETRFSVIRELFRAVIGQEPYAKGIEELTPLRGDPLAVVPVASAIAATLISPRLWKVFHKGAVGPYSLTPTAWDQIVAAAIRNENATL